MRNPTDSEFEIVREMAPQHRLLLQRWTELFDREVPYRWRLRPVTMSLLNDEVNEIKVLTRGRLRGQEILSGSPYLADLVKAEVAATPKSSSEAINRRTWRHHGEKLAEPLAQWLGLAGFHHIALYFERRKFLDGGAWEPQIKAIYDAYELRARPQEFKVLAPLADPGNVPPSSGFRVLKIDDVGQNFNQKYQEALGRRHCDPVSRALCREISTHDRNMAWQMFIEQYEQYRLRLDRRRNPAQLAKKAVFIYDPFEHDVLRFPQPPKYDYSAPIELSSHQIAKVIKAAQTDHTVDTLLDRYMEAVTAFKSDRIKQAFEILTPAFDVGFACDCAPFRDMRAFKRAGRVGSLLMAVTYPHALFAYLTHYLQQRTYLNDGRSGLTGASEDRLAKLADPRRWQGIENRYWWNILLQMRRQTMLNFMASPLEKLSRVRTVAEWDIGRTIRARHDFAHKGQPLTDNYLLAVTFDLVLTCMAVRASVVDTNKTFSDLVHTCENIISGRRAVPVEALLLNDKWGLAHVLCA